MPEGVEGRFPPDCFVTMNAHFLEDESRTALKVPLPVTEAWSNQIGTM